MRRQTVYQNQHSLKEIWLHEQESRESNCVVSNTKINDDHLKDSEKSSSENVRIDKWKVDSQNPKVASREHNQDNESVKENVGSEIADKSSINALEKSVKKSHAMKQTISERNPESKF